MKKQCTTVLMALAFSLLMMGTAFAKDIVVFNGTDFEITGLYMSSAEDDSWGANLLDGDQLKPGEGMRITVSGVPNNLDMAVVDDEGQELAFLKLDFSEFESLTIYTDGTGRFE